MRIRRAETRAFTLPLVQPLSTAHGRIDSRQGHLIRLIDDREDSGYGEATPLAEFGTEDLKASGEAIRRSLGTLIASEEISLDEALVVNARSCQGAPCARAAVDSALHDLAARRDGRSLSTWLRARAGLPGEPASQVQVQAIVAGDDPACIRSSVEALLADGFETFKLKLAVSGRGGDLGLDLERVAALRETVGPTRRIRLDANEAWSASKALSAIAAFERFDIDFVEQPVARGDLEALKDLDQHAAIPVAADEALLDSGWEACLEARAASIFVVKSAALGGIAPALDLSRRAREQDVRVVWSSLIDGVVSRAVGFALAAALHSKDEVHGLGTARLLARDLISGAELHGSSIEMGRSPGLDWHAGERCDEDDEIWGDFESLGSAS